jgi:hypothetical protein
LTTGLCGLGLGVCGDGEEERKKEGGEKVSKAHFILPAARRGRAKTLSRASPWQ